VEETLKGSSFKEEHHAMIGAALQGFQSAGGGLHEVFKNLITIFEVCFYPFIWVLLKI
jgi:hypothetical protein